MKKDLKVVIPAASDVFSQDNPAHHQGRSGAALPGAEDLRWPGPE